MSSEVASSSGPPVMDDPMNVDVESPEVPATPEVTQVASDKPTGRARQRSRSGCFTCRVRRKKCDEARPTCVACSKLGLRCDYRTPQWWATLELRKRQKERIKQRIRQTKSMDKEGSLQGYRERVSALLQRPPVIAPSTAPVPRPAFAEQPDAVPQPLPTPVTPGDSQFKAQQDAYLQNIGLASSSAFPQGSSSVPGFTFPQASALPPTPTSALSSTFSQSLSISQTQPFPQTRTLPIHPPGPSHVPPPTPLLSSNEWGQPNVNSAQPSSQQPFNPVDGGAPLFGSAQKPLSESLRSLISVEDRHRPLLDHFADKVLQIVFPILEVRPGPPLHTHEILGLMQTNSSYLHCCLSAAAIHLKNSLSLDDQMDHDIMEHRYASIEQLTMILDRQSTGHRQVMDATLGLIFYHSAVATTEDYLTDIPWSYHFQAVSNLVKRLNCTPSPMNISLIAWVDIMGATMLGETPQFSHTYRQKHTCGISSGLQHMMGCDDRLMYLISEIACLESLWNNGTIDKQSLFHHVSALNDQVSWTEATETPIGALYDPIGNLKVEELAKIVTAIFRIATRLYLHSILPNFDSYDATVLSWITAMGDLLQTLPSGPSGFDRCLAWPLFIAGLYSAPPSLFRKTLAERVAALRYLGDFGSIGRMYRVLREVWRVADESGRIPGSGTRPPKQAVPQPNTATQLAGQPRVQEVEEEEGEEQPGGEQQGGEQQEQEQQEQGVEEPGYRYVHWREVMKSKNWEYLFL